MKTPTKAQLGSLGKLKFLPFYLKNIVNFVVVTTQTVGLPEGWDSYLVLKDDDSFTNIHATADSVVSWQSERIETTHAEWLRSDREQQIKLRDFAVRVGLVSPEILYQHLKRLREIPYAG